MTLHRVKNSVELFLVVVLLLSIHAAPTAASPSAQNAEVLVYSQDFESGSLPDWSLEGGWEVAEVEGGHALRGSGHVWANLNAGTWYNYRYTFRLKLDANNSALHANIRIVGISRYFIGINRGGSYIAKQTGPDQFFHNLAVAGGIPSGWHTVELSAQEAVITVQVDGKRWLKYTDKDPLPLGGVAFESLDKGSVWIDDLQVFVPETEVSKLSWTRTGGPLGGLGYDVRMRPDNPDILYVTDAKAGVFKSTDGGKTWLPSNNGLTARTGETGELIPVFSLTIDPNNYDILWAGTQFQRGIYKTIDGGANWQKLDKGVVEKDVTFRGFTIQPGDSNIVYAAGEISSWEWNGSPLQGREFDLVKGVVYKTTDGGQNWVKIWEGDDLARYVWIDPRDTNVVYVSTGIFDREAANSDPQKGIAGGVGILKSVDGGKTWQQVNNGLGNLFVGSLFMHPQNPDILLAGTGSVQYSDKNGVYLSTDGGQSWQHTLSNWTIEAVEFSVSNPQIAYAGAYGGIWRSEDGGLTWNDMTGAEQGMEGWGSPGIMAGHPIDFMVDPRNPDRMFANQYGGGNFLTEDGGKTWQAASKGYTGAMIRDIVVDPNAPGRVIAASRSGIFVSYNGGEDWIGLASRPFYALDWHVIAIDPSNQQHFISGLTCYRNMVSSEDGGMSWDQVAQAPADTRIGFDVVAFAASNPKIIYAGSAGFYSCGSFAAGMPGAGVYFSNSGGKIWQRSADPLVKDLSIKDLAVNPRDPQDVFAGSFLKGLYHSRDGGQSWSQVQGGLRTDRSIGTVRFNPQNPTVLFTGLFQGGLYRSEDGGQTWQSSMVGLIPEASVVDLVFDPTNPDTIFLADLFSGVYQSKDGGKTWHAINQGLELRAVNALALSQDGQHLYAGSEGMGVFRLDLSEQPPAAVPTPSGLGKPTPAPTATAIPPTSPPAKPVTPSQTAEVTSPGKPAFKLPCMGGLIPLILMIGLSAITRKRYG